MKRYFLSLSAFALFALFGTSASSVDAAQSYRVNAGQSNMQVNEHGVCKKISNAGTKDVFIPTNTSAEWSGFLAHLPSGVTAGNCSNYGRIRVVSLGAYWNACVLLRTGNVDCLGVRHPFLAYNPVPFEDYLGGNAVSVTNLNIDSYNGYEPEQACALLANGNVDCWGDNSFGQSADYNKGDAVSVAAGDMYTCITTTAGNVDCWGLNSNGSASDENLGTAVSVTAGGMDNEIGGYETTCILRSNGNVDCRGGYNVDYLGGNATSVSFGGWHACAVLSNGNVDCWGWNASGESNDYNGGNAVAVSAGRYLTCALLNNGNVDCWGTNYYGESTDYNGGNAVAVSVGVLNSCIVFSNGNMDCRGWGSNSFDRNSGDIKMP